MTHEIKTLADFLNVLNGLTDEQLSQKVIFFNEDKELSTEITVIDELPENVYVNKDDNEDFGTLNELISNYDGNFGDKDLENYNICHPKGTILLYSGN